MRAQKTPLPNGSDIQEEIRALDIGHKVRQLRQQQQLTLQNVANMTGLSKALLSQIENNLAAPPISTLLKISRALAVGIGHFFQEDENEQRIVVVRRDERPGPIRRSHHPSSAAGYYYQSLAYPMAGKNMEPFMVEIDPLQERDLHFYNHQGEEFLFVLSGTVEFRGGDRVIALQEGDSLYFDAGLAHALRALEGEKARALVVVYAT
jgi:transcriptional regulator with XRE-family HTH domain